MTSLNFSSIRIFSSIFLNNFIFINHAVVSFLFSYYYNYNVLNISTFFLIFFYFLSPVNDDCNLLKYYYFLEYPGEFNYLLPSYIS